MDVCDSLIKWASDAKLFKHDICDEDHKAVAQAGRTNYRRTAQDTAGHYKTTAGHYRTLCGCRRCFVANQLWFMTRIREEDCTGTVKKKISVNCSDI